MEKEGRERMERLIIDCREARRILNSSGAAVCPDRKAAGIYGYYDIDETKLLINFRQQGVSGRMVEKFLRKEYNIQVEASDPFNILAFPYGCSGEAIRVLINALLDGLKKGFGQTDKKSGKAEQAEDFLRTRKRYISKMPQDEYAHVRLSFIRPGCRFSFRDRS